MAFWGKGFLKVLKFWNGKGIEIPLVQDSKDYRGAFGNLLTFKKSFELI